MQPRRWFPIKAIVLAVFGVGFVLAPVALGAFFGLKLDAAGALMARLFGGAYIGEAIIIWFNRQARASDACMRAILWGILVSNVVGLLITLAATIAGTWNALGWLPVALYLIFSLLALLTLRLRPGA